MKIWNPQIAVDWLVQTGMDHIRDGLSWEGGELIYEARWGGATKSLAKFIKALRRVCEWDDETIKEAIESM